MSICHDNRNDKGGNAVTRSLCNCEKKGKKTSVREDETLQSIPKRNNRFDLRRGCDNAVKSFVVFIKSLGTVVNTTLRMTLCGYRRRTS